MNKRRQVGGGFEKKSQNTGAARIAGHKKEKTARNAYCETRGVTEGRPGEQDTVLQANRKSCARISVPQQMEGSGRKRSETGRERGWGEW